jgi:hypothetical protein
MLPLGVVIPTKNSMPYLPAHLEGMRAWLDLAEQIVVVDSFSTDGSVEFLRAQLRHPRVTFTTHPPGLYASWNHGLAQVSAKYTFIATTGDLITRAGIGRLVGAAETLAADVVISKPDFRDPAGRSLPDIAWPVDDVISSLGLTAPRGLHKLEALVFAAAHPEGALLGSCASNIFRTEMLKRLPFPTEFGTAGDGAWGMRHAAEVAWAVVPEKFSTFLVHPTNASETERKTLREASRMDEVLRGAVQAWLAAGVVGAEELARVRWAEWDAALRSFIDGKTAFDRHRRGGFPWSLNPAAWRVRTRRNRARRRLDELKREALRAVMARG